MSPEVPSPAPPPPAPREPWQEQTRRLSGLVAHELNNLTTAIQASLSMLQESLQQPQGADPADCAEMLSMALRATERLRELGEDLNVLTPRHGVGGGTAACEVRAVVEQTLQRVTRRLFGQVVVELPPELPLVQAKARQLGRVLLALLSNAAEALEAAPGKAGGRVVVRAERGPNTVRLVVEDDGPGIAPEHLPHLFTPFFTTKPLGNGLGLALSWQHVQSFGGRLSMENRPEGGARFTVELQQARPV
jgi:two-component system, sensor histidine kinase PhcS